jgi:hypothetical protein
LVFDIFSHHTITSGVKYWFFDRIMVKMCLTTIVMLLLPRCMAYKVRTISGDLKEKTDFPCGSLSIQLEGKGNSQFSLVHRFDLEEKVLLFPDSIHVLFNGVELPGNIAGTEIPDSQRTLQIDGNEKFHLEFHTTEGVFEGDTICAYGVGFIKCRQDFITLDSVFYTFTNRLRIVGVNAR